MFDKSYVTVDPLALLGYIEEEIAILDSSIERSFKNCINYWLPRMKQRRWFGWAKPYWNEDRTPTIEEVDKYIEHQDCDWGMDFEFKSSKAVLERHASMTKDFIKLRSVAEDAANRQQPMYMKVNEYHRFIRNKENTYYDLWGY